VGREQAYRDFRISPDLPDPAGVLSEILVIRHGGLLSHFHDLYPHDPAARLFFVAIAGVGRSQGITAVEFRCLQRFCRSVNSTPLSFSPGPPHFLPSARRAIHEPDIVRRFPGQAAVHIAAHSPTTLLELKPQGGFGASDRKTAAAFPIGGYNCQTAVAILRTG
jgi:hypothetical protein